MSRLAAIGLALLFATSASAAASCSGREACRRVDAIDAVLLQTRQGVDKTAIREDPEEGVPQLAVDDFGPAGGAEHHAVDEATSTQAPSTTPELAIDDFGPAGGAEHHAANQPSSSHGHPIDPDADDGGVPLQRLQAEVAEDGNSASVSFEHEGKAFLYQLSAFSVYKDGARPVAHTGPGQQEPLTAHRRHFRTREHGKWASVSFREDGTITGLFEDQGRILEVSPTAAEAAGSHGQASLLAASSQAGIVHMARRVAVPNLLSGGLNATASPSKHGLTLSEVNAARDEWTGQAWWPGCYPGDSELHSFTVHVIADYSAYQKHGSATQGLMEEAVSQASHVYEQQLNIRLELADLEIHETTAGAPSYSQGCSSNFMNDKLNALRAANLPFAAVTHLFTGCGVGYGTVGLAYVNTICNSRGYNTGVNQFTGRTWLTFAHELGHNFGGDHSFEQGQGQTGGIMDYGDGTLNGEYQFNTQYRRTEMCNAMSQRVNQCQGHFRKATTQTQPNPTPAPCSDDASYRDPEYGATCSEWAGYACQPSNRWSGTSYRNTLRQACPVSCGTGCSPPATTTTAAPPTCRDTASYRDPEYGAQCSEWRGYYCQPSSSWQGASYQSQLRCACPESCNACSSLGSCSATTSPPATTPAPTTTTQAPTPAPCEDSPSYRDPEFGARCSAWLGWACQPSSAWQGASYANELKSQCPKSCRQC